MMIWIWVKTTKCKYISKKFGCILCVSTEVIPALWWYACLPTQEYLPSTLLPIINKAIFIIYSQNPLQQPHDELVKKSCVMTRFIKISLSVWNMNMIDESESRVILSILDSPYRCKSFGTVSTFQSKRKSLDLFVASQSTAGIAKLNTWIFIQ